MINYFDCPKLPFSGSGIAFLDGFSFRVEQGVTAQLPHRPVRAEFPHTVLQVMDLLHKWSDRFLVSPG